MHRRFTLAGPAGAELATDVVTYGFDIPREDQLKLLGHVEGKRVLDLGCGAGSNAIALAKAGAKVIAVDPSAEQIAEARAAAERAEVKLELHHAPLAELAFVRADTIDAVVSAYGLTTVADVDRVFRQVDRVLKPESHFVLSLPHPAWLVVDPEDPERRVRRSYWDAAPIAPAGGEGQPEVPRTIGALVQSLTRANFRIDNVIEPEPANGPHSPGWTDAMRYLPATLVIRARKQGL
ncbi:MAG: class I SAM-dependent methyltransferase [Actinomycetota bacterium]